MSDLITIGTSELTVRINPLGAELWSLTDAQGREYMTDADPAFWTGHAPLLFPVVGALAGGFYQLAGQKYPMPRHGFARRSLFELAEQHQASARFSLRDSGATRAVYPFAFELEMAFRVDGATLRMQATVENPGEVPLPFGFGFHPAFAWPLPGGGAKLAHAIIFARDEPAEVRRLDPASLIAAASEASPVRGSRLPLDPALFADDAIIWDELASRSLVYCGAAGSPRLEIAFPDTPYLGLWQKPGSNFLCIEPWAGLADEAGFAGDFRDKRGVIQVPPGESRSFRMDVTVRPG